MKQVDYNFNSYQMSTRTVQKKVSEENSQEAKVQENTETNDNKTRHTVIIRYYSINTGQCSTLIN